MRDFFKLVKIVIHKRKVGPANGGAEQKRSHGRVECPALWSADSRGNDNLYSYIGAGIYPAPKVEFFVFSSTGIIC